MKYRLGLDMGSTSIGWSIAELNEDDIAVDIIDTGVRIFPDGRDDKSKESLCVSRRNARGARRLHNRYKQRRSDLINKLIEIGLFPMNIEDRKSLEKLNPYKLRSDSVNEKLTKYELGRALFHLSQRRGFKSSRKDDAEQGGKLKDGYKKLQEEMLEHNCKTYGQYLYKKLKNGENARLNDAYDDSGNFIGNASFPFRDTYINEFDIIWDKQAEFYPDVLNLENKNKIKETIFFQRALKEQEEGTCTLEKGEPRIAKAHPLFQEFRLLQTINIIKYAEKNDTNYRNLTQEERDKLLHILNNPQDYDTTAKGRINLGKIKKYLNLHKYGKFNLEGKGFKYSKTAEDSKSINTNSTVFAIYNEKSNTENLKKEWSNISSEQQEKAIEIISRPDIDKYQKLSADDYTNLVIKELIAKVSLTEESAKELAMLNLEDGFGNLSKKAIRNILPYLREGSLYSEACEKAEYHHSQKEYEHIDKLPYYGEILSEHCLGKKSQPKNIEEEFGKINNATVHVALNQIRHLVNEIISLYGKPFDIAIEYGRDLSAGSKERSKMTNVRDKNEKENEKIRKELIDKGILTDPKRYDIQKYKIWKNLGIGKGDKVLDRECPFSGEKISLTELFNGNKFQIEHILPFSITLDDSLNNKVIALITANKFKGNRTPWEAFNESPNGYNWDDIKRRAMKLSSEQQWRFNENAMKKFSDKEGPIARALNDTRYMTRLLQEYLLPICREDGKKTVLSVPGKLTSLVRKSWGLNEYKEKTKDVGYNPETGEVIEEKNEDYRAFHNHHAMDAIVISSLSRSQLQQVVPEMKRCSNDIMNHFKDDFYKLRDSLVSKEEKKELKKRIRDFRECKEQGIISEYIPIPKKLNVFNIKEKVANINISYKPKTKNPYDLKSTVGQLHEDTAYGIIGFLDDKSLKAKFHVHKEDKNKKVDALKDNSIVSYIPMFHTQEDKKAYYNAYKEWFINDGKAKLMNAKTKEEKALKKEQSEKELQTVLALREASLKSFKWFVGGGNFCAEIYEINPQNKHKGVAMKNAGKWEGEIISNYNATVRAHNNEPISYLHYKYPNAKKIMTLKMNDMVMATFNKEQAFDDKFPKGIQNYVREKFNKEKNLENIAILFRVKKINSAGTLFLRPHNIAKEEADKKCWIASISGMGNCNAKKVFVSSTGKIKDVK
ncbi:MAG: type II CRISPR RNA-guided endonuclease Cas9 [Alphaproteobacteria bacterium]|nr:type II CRISPR RNA-guided endonuclease Cas9 [Alphaproteobacteria bacterium]